MDDSHKCDAEQRCLYLNLGVGYLGVVTLWKFIQVIHFGLVYFPVCVLYT